MIRCLSFAALCLLLLALVACGSASRRIAADRPGGLDYDPYLELPPTTAQLESLLDAEFARLSIDPSKVTAAAASGSENSVFDLSASLIDPDGPPDGQGGGLLPPTGIQLKWTERHQGDYDGNGIVAVNDLTPIGLEFQRSVSYDDPALHGGLKHFPAGDPDDTAGGVNSDAANWALARVDGNADGKITVQDLTPIAVHYQQRIYGYRVYRKGPNDSGFVLQEAFSGPPPSPGGEDSYVTLKHPASVPAAQPVRYSYANGPAPDGSGSGGSDEFDPGVYQFYVVPWDSTSNTEGQRSTTLSIDIETGLVNQGPVANLTVTPDFAGAPAVITLDASQSVDVDGEIAEYRWDLDGDGMTDYSSLDPEPPAQSSSGKVTEITPGVTPAELSAKFIQGSEAYYLPTVRVVDDDGLLSANASDQLGISGWVDGEILYSELPGLQPEWGNMDYDIRHLAENPTTGRLVAYGWATGTGVMYSMQEQDGSWSTEVAASINQEPWLSLAAGLPNLVFIFTIDEAWQANGQPELYYTAARQSAGGDAYRIFRSRRSSSGVWSTTVISDGTGIPKSLSKGIQYSDLVQLEPDITLVLGIAYTSSDSSNSLGRYGLFRCVSNSVTLELPGWDELLGTPSDIYPHCLTVDNLGNEYVLLNHHRDIDPYGIFAFRREPAADWEFARLDDGSLAHEKFMIQSSELAFDTDNNPIVSAWRTDLDERPHVLFTKSGSAWQEYELVADLDGGPSSGMLHLKDDLLIVSTYDRPLDLEPMPHVSLSVLIDNSTPVFETVLSDPSITSSKENIFASVQLIAASGQAVALGRIDNGKYNIDGERNEVRLLMYRVDPRDAGQ